MYNEIDLAFERMKVLIETADMHETILNTLGIGSVSPFITYSSNESIKHFYYTENTRISVLFYTDAANCHTSIIPTYEKEILSVLYNNKVNNIRVYKDCDSSLEYNIDNYMYPNTEENIFQNCVLFDELTSRCIYMYNKVKEIFDSAHYNAEVFSISVINDNEKDIEYYKHIMEIHSMYKELLCI